MAEKKAETKKAEPEELTPSAIANREVGEPKEDASDEEKVAHAERWRAARRRARRGF